MEGVTVRMQQRVPAGGRGWSLWVIAVEETGEPSLGLHCWGRGQRRVHQAPGLEGVPRRSGFARASCEPARSQTALEGYPDGCVCLLPQSQEEKGCFQHPPPTVPAVWVEPGVVLSRPPAVRTPLSCHPRVRVQNLDQLPVAWRPDRYLW